MVRTRPGRYPTALLATLELASRMSRQTRLRRSPICPPREHYRASSTQGCALVYRTNAHHHARVAAERSPPLSPQHTPAMGARHRLTTSCRCAVPRLRQAHAQRSSPVSALRQSPNPSRTWATGEPCYRGLGSPETANAMSPEST
jgi:hypothetical protein